MANVVDPVFLDLGISEGSKFGPMWNTIVATPNATKNEQRAQQLVYPRHKGDLSFGVRTVAQMESLIAFYNGCQGNTRGFLFWDNRDHRVITQQLGTLSNPLVLASGDGATKDFQLIKTYTNGYNTSFRKITRPLLDNTVVEGARAPLTPLKIYTGADTSHLTLLTLTTDYVINSLGKISLVAALGAGTNEAQQLSVTGSPTGGHFQITITTPAGSGTTAAIAYNCSPTDVQTAINALPLIGTGGVSCTGTSFPTGPISVFYVGAFPIGSCPQSAMTISAALTGGTSPAIGVTRPTPGVLGNKLWWTGNFTVPVRFDGTEWAAWDIKNVTGNWDAINVIEVGE